MVAAKLDENKVLVTKFRQNRLTLKVEVPVKHTHTDTHRQTNSAEIKGPSGLQSGQQKCYITQYRVLRRPICATLMHDDNRFLSTAHTAEFTIEHIYSNKKCTKFGRLAEYWILVENRDHRQLFYAR